MTVNAHALSLLAGRRLFVGTPMIDDRCHSAYAFAMIGLSELCARHGIVLGVHFIAGESLVTRARNATVDAFLKSGDDHLLFVDADIGFDPHDALHLLAMQALDPEQRFDVVAAPYPIKRIDWTRVSRALAAGADPAASCSEIRIDPADAPGFRVGEPLRVVQAGTGFMMIRRGTFAAYAARYPGRRYRRDRQTDGEAPWIHAFFETEVDSRHGNMVEELRALLASEQPVDRAAVAALVDDIDPGPRYDGRYVSEDYAFCRRVRAAGMQVWLCPWMALTHSGGYRFESRVSAITAAAGADA